MKNRSIGLVLLLWAAGIAGCAGLGKPLETPRVSLADIQVQQSKGLETTFLVHLRVTNPNEVDLEIKGVECDLEINGKPFAYGISSTQVKVPAFGSETIPVAGLLVGAGHREGPFRAAAARGSELPGQRQGAYGGRRADALDAAV